MTRQAAATVGIAQNRVARLATHGLRTKGRRLPSRLLPERLFAAKGGRVTTLAAGLERPVGIALKDGRLDLRVAT